VEFILLFVLLTIILLNRKLSETLATLAECVVFWTAQKLPTEIRDRFQQDWLADLDDHKTGFFKLWFASGLIWGVKTLQRECKDETGKFVITSVPNAPKRRPIYLSRARKRFLKGTSFESPVQAVEAGVRTLQEWALTLAEEREIEMQYLQEKQLRKIPGERQSRK
jgi:hypothetical protein